MKCEFNFVTARTKIHLAKVPRSQPLPSQFNSEFQSFSSVFSNFMLELTKGTFEIIGNHASRNKKALLNLFHNLPPLEATRGEKAADSL